MASDRRWDWPEAVATLGALLGAAMVFGGCVVSCGVGLDERQMDSLAGGLVRLGGAHLAGLGALLVVAAVFLHHWSRRQER